MENVFKICDNTVVQTSKSPTFNSKLIQQQTIIITFQKRNFASIYLVVQDLKSIEKY